MILAMCITESPNPLSALWRLLLTPRPGAADKVYNEEALATQPLCVLCHGFSISGVRHFNQLAAKIASHGIPVMTLASTQAICSCL